ncbi:RNA polymerase Rpb4-domain-containing protein [Boletus reticuloceps]|uniref:DNA-directed RNA polymerase III subunit RPC9 n=1 Tax=Boletus reticuloceps TaxID=495285 RepID=A0A8I2YSS7_9AGAM|nr:RNA polymerase Rpb4-domain-containing protein [Boletus reticuloceps]
MEVLHPRAALLSNFEVLTLLRELDADHVARTKTALRIKKEEDAAGKPTLEPHTEEVSENLRTVELETIQYLSADYQPTLQQSEHGISQLVRDLAPLSLTKAEKLQVVNLAPTEPVELYVIIEELEDRLGDCMDEILGIVTRSLSATAGTAPAAAQSTSPTNGPTHTEIVDAYEVEQGWEHDAEDADFDDSGDVRVEGDLDMEQDD